MAYMTDSPQINDDAFEYEEKTTVYTEFRRLILIRRLYIQHDESGNADHVCKYHQNLYGGSPLTLGVRQTEGERNKIKGLEFHDSLRSTCILYVHSTIRSITGPYEHRNPRDQEVPTRCEITHVDMIASYRRRGVVTELCQVAIICIRVKVREVIRGSMFDARTSILENDHESL